ncbi:hypothetical protein chiPu_0018326 [Chiloscyllium punctatum]|uniref:Uncharacterized protein n=1 Tax=Chiloscyllium punctatum TaxID=137246 RepID=A0A401RMM5_CHIPU|nr:hypothetical protein [Chiloscyllium punctatum]
MGSKEHVRPAPVVSDWLDDNSTHALYAVTSRAAYRALCELAHVQCRCCSGTKTVLLSVGEEWRRRLKEQEPGAAGKAEQVRQLVSGEIQSSTLLHLKTCGKKSGSN